MDGRKWIAALATALLLTVPVVAAEFNPVTAARETPGAGPSSTRVIVKLRPVSGLGVTTGGFVSSSEVLSLAGRTRLKALHTHPITERLHVLEFQPAAAAETEAASLARLRADPAVEYADIDEHRYAHAAPDDTLFQTGQWFLKNAVSTPSAIDALDAWGVVTGSPGVVIAVIDTGVIFDHPDLLRATQGGRFLPGYDFITNIAVGNTGLGWNPDASDPGDWVTSADLQTSQFSKCTVSNSSWHGTRVSGIVGALTNNAAGVSGINWQGWILPVRALGKCGGTDSDIVSAMLWAAGIAVAGAPSNPYPARIENLSLGGTGTCPAVYVDALNQLAARGVLVVASAGNEGGPVDVPANCPGVVGVAGLRHAGTKVGFSSLGPEIALSAPAGNCVNTGAGQPCLYSIDTTFNLGTTVPTTNGYTDQYNTNLGTSFSAPIVASIAGLMLAANGNLTPTQLLARLEEGAAKPFPVSSDVTIPQCHVPANASDLQTTECNCTTVTCGAGMANAFGAVTAALRPIAAIAVPATITAGANLSLDASGSTAACGRGLAKFQWAVSQTSGGATAPTLTGASTAVVTAPAPGSGGSYVLTVTVTDDAGGSDAATVLVTSDSASTAAPSSAGSTACLAAVSGVMPAIGLGPTAAVVPVGTSRTFSTAYTGNTVNWSVNGVIGGTAATGLVTTAGVYTAPSTVPSPAAVTLTAQSVADASISASAIVTITNGPPVTVSVSPASATVQTSATATFSATVMNGPSSTVSWQVNGIAGGNSTVGTVSGPGVYTAPATVPSSPNVTVTAVSAADSGASASAQVTIQAAPAAVSSGGSHGGGALGLVTVGGLAVSLALALRARRLRARLQRASRVG